MTAAGVSVCMDISTTSVTASSGIGVVYVDINGQKGPNIFGRDAFAMYIYPDGTLDRQSMSGCREGLSSCLYGNLSSARNLSNSFCTGARSWGETSQCFGSLINDNWEMKY